MSGSDPSPLQIVAHATVSAANPPVFSGGGQDSAMVGFSACAFTNPGVYAFTLDAGVLGDGPQIPTLQMRIIGTLRTPGILQAVKTSTSVITINTFAVDGTTATNKAFDLVVYRSPV